MEANQFEFKGSSAVEKVMQASKLCQKVPYNLIYKISYFPFWGFRGRLKARFMYEVGLV